MICRSELASSVRVRAGWDNIFVMDHDYVVQCLPGRLMGCPRGKVNLIEYWAFPVASGIGIGISRPRTEFKACDVNG